MQVKHAEKYLAAYPNARVLVASEDPNLRKLATESFGTRLLMREIRGYKCDGGSISGVSGECGVFDLMPSVVAGTNSNGLELAEDVLIDTLLLARCSFLLRGNSGVAQAATYFNPVLAVASVDFSQDLVEQDLPTWW